MVISKDEDFLYLATITQTDARLVWVRFGNCRTPALLAAIERAWPFVEQALKAGDRVVELL